MKTTKKEIKEFLNRQNSYNLSDREKKISEAERTVIMENTYLFNSPCSKSEIISQIQLELI